MLTKAQKMKMVSDAIDKGFTVELRKHDVEYENTLELLEAFPGLPTAFGGHKSGNIAWIWFNLSQENDKFSGSIHLK